MMSKEETERKRWYPRGNCNVFLVSDLLGNHLVRQSEQRIAVMHFKNVMVYIITLCRSDRSYLSNPALNHDICVTPPCTAFSHMFMCQTVVQP